MGLLCKFEKNKQSVFPLLKPSHPHGFQKIVTVFFRTMLAILLPLMFTAIDGLDESKNLTAATVKSEMKPSFAISESEDLIQLQDYQRRQMSSMRISSLIPLSNQELLLELPILWPLEGEIGYISNVFGAGSNAFTGKPYFQKGLDISNARSGDPISAAADGAISFTGYNATYGNNIIIQHENGYTTRYAHLKTMAVNRGQSVLRGSVIGTVGKTGLTTGPHLHCEVLLAGKLTDPLKYVNIARSRPALIR